jgi:hypothetical protein
MTKYDNAKYLTKVKAKTMHECHQCGGCIEAGEFYYKERVDMRPPPSLILRTFCERCGISKCLNVNPAGRRMLETK